MKSIIELRRQTLANTEAMLSQKRASVLRRIILSYRFDGQQLTPASDHCCPNVVERTPHN
jgi:hypothetical protein